MLVSSIGLKRARAPRCPGLDSKSRSPLESLKTEWLEMYSAKWVQTAFHQLGIALALAAWCSSANGGKTAVVAQL